MIYQDLLKKFSFDVRNVLTMFSIWIRLYFTRNVWIFSALRAKTDFSEWCLKYVIVKKQMKIKIETRIFHSKLLDVTSSTRVAVEATLLKLTDPKINIFLNNIKINDSRDMPIQIPQRYHSSTSFNPIIFFTVFSSLRFQYFCLVYVFFDFSVFFALV